MFTFILHFVLSVLLVIGYGVEAAPRDSLVCTGGIKGALSDQIHVHCTGGLWGVTPGGVWHNR